MFYKVNLFANWLLINRIAFCIVSSLLIFTIFYEIHRVVRSPALKQDVPEEEVPVSEQLQWRIMGLNEELQVRNAEAFRMVPQGRSRVVVVQAGRGTGLPRLLRALSAVRGIDEAVLIISHSVYDPKVNRLVRAIRFCRVVQVFYPYSLQLHPDKYPGRDPSDCSENNTDPFCQPRDAARVEIKLHWWWTLHFVFAYIPREHRGAVLFLEDSDYVTPDLLYMLQYTERAFFYHPEVDVISLGGPYAANADYGLLIIEPWQPFDRGLAFNRTVYNKIEAMAARYCAWEDDSWSYSLLNVFAGLPRGYATMVSPAAARVRAKRAAALKLFPVRVRSALTLGARGRVQGAGARAPPRGNGGWGDVRDQLLCHDPFRATTTYSPPPTTPPDAS